MKVEPVMPSSRARLVICSAKAASLPASPSATTTQASLPDCTMMPWIRSPTVTLVPASTNMREPSIDWACGLTRNSVSLVTRPSRIASNSM